MKLAMLTPSARDPKWRHMQSVFALSDHMRLPSSAYAASVAYLANSLCSLLPQGRQRLLGAALKGDFTHALWLDDDMAFPEDTVERLARHGKAAVGVNYLRKSAHPEYTAVRDGVVISSDPPATGIVPADDCGLGVFLLDLNAIRHIPAPHFEILWDEKTGSYIGEDRYFMRKLKKHGVQVFIDHDLSRLVSHIGDFTYGQAFRRMMEAKA